jgi:hypothetical protein
LLAFLLNGQELMAFASEITGDAARHHTEAAMEHVVSTLKQVENKSGEDATIRFAAIKLKQSGMPLQLALFQIPADEVITLYAARAPGANFLKRLFLSSIQPNAP